MKINKVNIALINLSLYEDEAKHLLNVLEDSICRISADAHPDMKNLIIDMINILMREL